MKTYLERLLSFLILVAAQPVFASEGICIKSTDGNISFLLSDTGKYIQFQMLFNNNVVITPSPVLLSVNWDLIYRRSKTG
jgi:hypothetical protein